MSRYCPAVCRIGKETFGGPVWCSGPMEAEQGEGIGCHRRGKSKGWIKFPLNKPQSERARKEEYGLKRPKTERIYYNYNTFYTL